MKISISLNHLTIDIGKVSFKVDEHPIVLLFSAVTDSGRKNLFDVSGQRHTERIYLLFFFFHFSLFPHVHSAASCRAALPVDPELPGGRLERSQLQTPETPHPPPTHHLKAERQQHLLTWPLSPSSAARRRPPRQIAASVFHVSLPGRQTLVRLAFTRLLLWEQRVVLGPEGWEVGGEVGAVLLAWLWPGSSPLDSAKMGMCTSGGAELKCDFKRMYCYLKRLKLWLSCSSGFILVVAAATSSHQGW